MSDVARAASDGPARVPDVTEETGLTEAEAQRRLATWGPNRLPPPQHKTFAAMALAVAAQPMVLLLLACALVYAVLGSTGDSVALGISVVVVMGISVYQQLRTQRVLEALRELSSPRSTVVRDGAVKHIASQLLVPGDLLIVQEGDRLACDATLLRSHGMRVDESLLTGESLPIDKECGTADAAAARLQAGTLVVQGDGAAHVTATGVHTALGKIHGSIASVPQRVSRLHRELTRLVQRVAMFALLVCALAAIVFAWREGSWTAGLLVGLTLAMSVVPEEFAVVWSVMLALGAWRLAQFNVLTRQPQAIETLGATTVLCVDKTGTLTCNRMEVAALHNGESFLENPGGAAIPPAFEPLLRAAAMASVKEGVEPMDRAIFSHLRGPEPVSSALALVRREGVVPGRPFMRQSWRVADDDRVLVMVKGAPEAVLSRCAGAADLLARLAQHAHAWAAQGMRVIAVARIRWADGTALPEAGYEAVGLIAFADPLRDDVAQALVACRSAGVRVVMITGDAAPTALAIARQAGLTTGDDAAAVMTGAQLDALADAELDRAIARTSVFARVAPAQKLRIVQALQRRGEVVAMTGDGVNDGPALRASDVGVAMGQRGTDVAREAADLVLLDDRFSSLVDAVRAGRRIFANLQKAVGYLLAVHVPIVGLALLPLLGGPVLLLPIHVVVLELIIDPACSLVFEAEPMSDDAMNVPPRPADALLFGPSAQLRAIAVGGVALLPVALMQWFGHAAQWSDEALRLAGLGSIVLGNLAMLQWFRRGRRQASGNNPAFDSLLLGVCIVSAGVVLIPGINAAFGFPSAPDAVWTLGLLGLPMAWFAWRLATAHKTRRERIAGA